MEYNHYIATKRARIVGICGEVNIPYGTEIEAADGFLLFDGKPLCAADSQNAYDYTAAANMRITGYGIMLFIMCPFLTCIILQG